MFETARLPLMERLLRTACLLVFLGLLLFGLWPFNFFPRNRISWLPNRPGARFFGGMAYSPEPLAFPGPISTQGLTVEILLTPAKKAFSQYSEIVSLHQLARHRAFILSQDGTTLYVLGRYHTPTKPSGIPGMSILRGLVPEQSQLVTVTTGGPGTFIYCNGRIIDTYPGTVPFSGLLGGRLVLGNSATGRYPWTGEVRGLAIFDHPLTPEEVSSDYSLWMKSPDELAKRSGIVAAYRFDEGSGTVIHDSAGHAQNLLVPTGLRPLQKIFLEVPSKGSFAHLDDVAVNFLGFMPYGFLLAAYQVLVKRRSGVASTVLAVVVGFLTSLAIEALQVYLPSRDSSWTDVINNTIGTAAGCLVLFWSRICPGSDFTEERGTISRSLSGH